MLKFIKLGCSLTFLSACIPSFSQVDVPVDHVSGRPEIVIPITTVSARTLSTTVSLSYDASGVRIDQMPGIAGQNWDVVAAGEVRREVRGLPDDYSVSNDARTGWLHNNNASTVGTYSFPADNSTLSCSAEPSHFAFIEGFKFTRDSEPDVFYFKAPGIYGSFVLDNSGNAANIKCIPYQEVKIVLTRPVAEITAITITDYLGNVHTFNIRETVSRKTEKDAGTADPLFFANEYQMYKSPLSFSSAWKLSSIKSPSGEQITFGYTTIAATNVSRDVEVMLANTSGSFTSKKLYSIVDATVFKLLNSISAPSREVYFTYQDNETTLEGKLLESISVNEKRNNTAYFNRLFRLKYIETTWSETIQLFKRPFLSEVVEQDPCELSSPYKLSYYGLADSYIQLPGAKAIDQDIWGYHIPGFTSVTGKIPKVYIYPSSTGAGRVSLFPRTGVAGEIIIAGADRISNPTPNTGVLSDIIFPTGSRIFYEYESNTFQNPVNNAVTTGGGLRIKKIRIHDGVSYRNDIVKEFEYLTAGGTTSGLAVNLPVFWTMSGAHLDPSTGAVTDYSAMSGLTLTEQWRRLLVRSPDNLNPNFPGGNIMYSRVTEKQTGLGKTVYEFEIPNPYGSVATSEWSPTYTHIARSSACPSPAFNLPGFYTAPVTISTPFDFKRGLLKKVQVFAESDVHVLRETIYNYSDISISPSTVKGFHFELVPYSSTGYYYMYGSYTLGANKLRLPTNIIERERDRVSTSNYLEKSTDITYGNSHPFPVLKKVTNSDGSQLISRIKYVKDYPVLGIASSSDQQVLCIDGLQDTFRYGTIVEEVQSVIPPGGTETTFNGSLTMFENLGTTSSPIVVAREALTLAGGDGVQGFVLSDIIGSSSKTFQKSSLYRPAGNVKYNARGDLIRVENVHRILSSAHVDISTGQPVVHISQAEPHEVLVSTFDHDTDYDFGLIGSFTTTEKSSDGRMNSLGLSGWYASSNKYLKATLKKRPGTKYIFSAWYKPVGTQGTHALKVTIKSTANTQLMQSNIPIAVTAANQWHYCEQMIDLSAVSNTDVVVEITFAGSYFFPAGTPTSTLDDVFFYPADADLDLKVSGSPFGVTSIQSSTGQNMEIDYDGSGRLKYQRDGQGNIISKSSYSRWSNDPSAVTPLDIFFEDNIQEGISTIFNAVTSCIDVSVIEWKVEPAGTNTGVYFAGANDQSYTFSSAGSYDVWLKVSHPSYGSYEVEKKNITVSLRPLTVTICAHGGTTIDLCDLNPEAVESCGGAVPSGNTHTVFNVTSISGCSSGATYTYRWQKRPNSSTSWAYTGSNDAPLSVLNTASYEIRCEAKSSCGKIGFSTIKKVTVYRSNPSCSQP